MISENHLTKLSFLGTGLLVGASLGVIIPEGIETIASSHPNTELPTPKIALCLLVGFTFMLIVEQFLSPHSHSQSSSSIHLERLEDQHTQPAFFDSELADLEREQGVGVSGHARMESTLPELVPKKVAFPLTLGLFIHGLADGLALGASAASKSETEAYSELSIIVFFALMIHKAPTALALTTSLLTTSLTRPECRKHLAFFSVSTPFGAILSYILFSFLGSQGGDWTGMALLISGGTFLYVATVLQPVSHSQSSAPDDVKERTRALLIIVGIFIPYVIGNLLGHGHEHGHQV